MAINIPKEKSAGDAKDVKTFVAKHRTQEYYDETYFAVNEHYKLSYDETKVCVSYSCVFQTKPLKSISGCADLDKKLDLSNCVREGGGGKLMLTTHPCFNHRHQR